MELSVQYKMVSYITLLKVAEKKNSILCASAFSEWAEVKNFWLCQFFFFHDSPPQQKINQTTFALKYIEFHMTEIAKTPYLYQLCTTMCQTLTMIKNYYNDSLQAYEMPEKCSQQKSEESQQKNKKKISNTSNTEPATTYL